MSKVGLKGCSSSSPKNAVPLSLNDACHFHYYWKTPLGKVADQSRWSAPFVDTIIAVPREISSLCKMEHIVRCKGVGLVDLFSRPTCWRILEYQSTPGIEGGELDPHHEEVDKIEGGRIEAETLFRAEASPPTQPGLDVCY